MINIFNRAVLFNDTNAQDAAKAQSALKKAGIPYKLRKEKSGSAKSAVRVPVIGKTGNMGVDPQVNAYVTGGVPHKWMEGGSSDTLYIIYVSKKELDRAKEICDIQ